MPKTYNKGHLLIKEAKINLMKIVNLQLFFSSSKELAVLKYCTHLESYTL